MWFFLLCRYLCVILIVMREDEYVVFIVIDIFFRLWWNEMCFGIIENVVFVANFVFEISRL